VLAAWAVLYLGIVFALAKRCVLFSKALSNEISTSTGRLIDAIANADLVRAFAKADYERRFISHFLIDEENASRRLRTFLIVMRTFMAVATLALPRQPDHSQRAGAVLPPARLLRAIGHARRSARAGQPAA
jgi:ATP-binding cassette subfamily B protein